MQRPHHPSHITLHASRPPLRCFLPLVPFSFRGAQLKYFELGRDSSPHRLLLACCFFERQKGAERKGGVWRVRGGRTFGCCLTPRARCRVAWCLSSAKTAQAALLSRTAHKRTDSASLDETRGADANPRPSHREENRTRGSWRGNGCWRSFCKAPLTLFPSALSPAAVFSRCGHATAASSATQCRCTLSASAVAAVAGASAKG